MCGIHLIVQKNHENSLGDAAIHRMMKALEHRGPDGSSFVHLQWDMEQIWLGHNLLAISERPEMARQPMITPDGICGIILNGQIYNYKHLRSQLIAEGVVFQTDGDTEVLLHWLRIKGRKGIRRLAGMYAFVFWNSDKQLLLIHRDGYGIKPLYYARNRHFFVASSEPEGIEASGLFRFSSDVSSISYFLKYRFIPDPFSPWLGIKTLQPGEVVEYWESKPMHYQAAVEEDDHRNATIADVLDLGFREVIPGDQRVGVMVSGGIDSSLIWHWCIQNKIDVVPFSIRFSGKTSAPKSDQEAVENLMARFKQPVEWVDVEHIRYDEIARFGSGLKPLVGDTAWFLTDRIARRAKDLGIRVLLSGAGADEYFGGYRRHWYYHQWERYVNILPDKVQFQLLKRILRETIDWHQDKHFLPQAIWDKAVSLPLSPKLKAAPYLSMNHKNEDETYLQSALGWDRRYYLPNDVLTVTDMGTMAHGVEGRFPFLHPAITGWASSFSAEHHLKYGRKWMLRRLVESFAGNELATRRKQGFGIPMEAFLNSESGTAWKNKLLVEKAPVFSPWFDKADLLQLEQKASKRPAFYAQQIFTLCHLGEWLENNGL